MLVRHLALNNFRNYSDLEIYLEPGSNLFIGSNGQGKTNLVESLIYLGTTFSHRSSDDKALIKFGSDSAVIRAQIQHQEREILAEVQINRTEINRAQINKSVIKTRELTRYFSCIFFVPEDLALVRGDPSVRRKFLDQLLSIRSPRMAAVFSDYERVLKQRNVLLKSIRVTKTKNFPTLDIWDLRLAQLGSEIIKERNLLVELLNPFVKQAYLDLIGYDHFPNLTMKTSLFFGESQENFFSYTKEKAPGFSSEDLLPVFLKKISELRNQEIERGLSLCGPHRDDVFFELNKLPVKGYASHGESWSFVLALKLASAELLRTELEHGHPVLVLDDVFAELDERRRNSLAKSLVKYEQVLITSAVYQDIPQSLHAQPTVISHGKIMKND